MSTERLNATPALLARIVAERLWGDSDFFLLDIGASGGIERHWAVFGDRLRAIGFDPLVTEVERLQAQAAGTKIRYEPAFVTCRDFDVLFPRELRDDRLRTKNNDPFQRVSAVRTQELLRMNYVERVFNAGAPTVYADRRVVLDDFVPAAEHPSVDFIKIDTDGHDFEVLLGADAIVGSGGALGFSIEAQLHGAVHDYANTFANIDRWMRSHGYSLFDLEVYRYSRSALPAPFTWDIPAQTLTGQVLWGEAIYLRDLGDADYERMWGYEATRERVLKLACLFELFGLPDCAAELLLKYRALVGGPATDALLDALAAPGATTPGAYGNYVRTFEADPQGLYRSRRLAAAEAERKREAETASAQQDAQTQEIKDLRARVSQLKEKSSELIDRVRRRDEKIEELVRRLAEARGEQRAR